MCSSWMMTDRELELYVHIPFCVRKCAYCDFLSFPSGERERKAYVDALIREIESRKDNFTDCRVSTVFLGGGTPSLLDGEDTARLFDALYRSFTFVEDPEITIEANPGTVTAEKMISWRKSGISRLSIGLQSVNDEELRMLGRIHTYREFLDTYSLARDAGFGNINIDLISAIPGQTVKSWEKTLRTVAELAPEHISAYSLIVEEGTPFYNLYGEEQQKGLFSDGKISSSSVGGFPPLPDEEEDRKIYEQTAVILNEYGYHRYEISNYAKQGYECRHNLGYWERKEYLGLGLGAASLIRETRFHNTADMKKYMDVFSDGTPAENVSGERNTASAGTGEIQSGNSAGQDDVREEFESLSREEQMAEFMILGLRKTAGISAEEFRSLYGTGIKEVYGSQIRRFEKEGLLTEEDGMIRLTPRGIDVSNYVFCEFV
mgnify:FL=1